MKTKTFFGFVLATLIALFAISAVVAELPVNINEVEVNDVVVGSTVTLAGEVSQNVPVVIRFTANASLEDLKVKVWIDGYKSDISASTARFDVVNGSTYIKKLSLTLPSVNDMEDLTEGLTLYVRIADKNDEVEADYNIEMQRESYAYEFLQADTVTSAQAGEIIAVDVVLKNIGNNELEDSFVSVAIPELGVSKKAYFGDLTPTDCADDDCDKEDARERRVYLVIPADVKTGDYTLEVKASNYDATATVRKVVSIKGTAADKEDNGTETPDNKDAGIPTSIVVLTVVLVVIFVVLLIVLIVLLTKKPSEKSEDFGETSYY